MDLGCGNGILTQKLSDMGYKVIGLDASEPMLERAKKDFPELEFKLADATDFTLDRKADCIFTNSVIHWIDKDLWPKLLSNISDNLAPGGTFVCELEVMAVPRLYTPPWRKPSQITAWSTPGSSTSPLSVSSLH